MEKKCQEAGCEKEGIISCECNRKLLFCYDHYENHRSIGEGHKFIKIHNERKLFVDKLIKMSIKTKQIQNASIDKASLMANIIKNNIKDIFSHTRENKKKLYKEIISDHFYSEEPIPELEVAGDDLNEFSEYIKSYLRININNEDSLSPIFHIREIKEESNEIKSKLEKLSKKLVKRDNAITNILESNSKFRSELKITKKELKNEIEKNQKSCNEIEILRKDIQILHEELLRKDKIIEGLRNKI